jgi:LptA/(LptD N-terminal domain) LPS transport protein
VNASRFDYDAETETAVYRAATLWQGATAVRGEVISLDRRRGDLLVRGTARSTFVLDEARSDGQAPEIRYDEASRVLTYSTGGVAPTSGSGQAADGKSPEAPVSGPQGDLRADRIEVILAPAENHVARLEAYEGVRLVRGQRTATGDRLSYFAADERYVMSGASSPVVVRDACRETRGRTLTFYASTDRIVVDGDEARRTETRPCTPEAR